MKNSKIYFKIKIWNFNRNYNKQCLFNKKAYNNYQIIKIKIAILMNISYS